MISKFIFGFYSIHAGGQQYRSQGRVKRAIIGVCKDCSATITATRSLTYTGVDFYGSSGDCKLTDESIARHGWSPRKARTDGKDSLTGAEFNGPYRTAKVRGFSIQLGRGRGASKFPA
eukprot:IDg6054t1